MQKCALPCCLKFCLSFVLLGEILMQSASAEAPAWPNWMGPNRDGVSSEADWSTNWPDDGLPVRWTRKIGIGFSSISIADGRLYTMGHVDGEEFVWCLSAESGQPIWSHHYPGELNDNLHEGGPGSTPTLDGDLVYTLGKEGQFYCLEAKTGKIRWEKQLKSDLEVATPEWGFSSSPVIIGGQLLLEAGRVVSYDKLTGEKQWQTDRHEAGYGSAALMEFERQKFVVTLDCDGLRVVRLQTGEQVAFREWPSPFRTNSTTPIIQGNQIYISSAYQVGCGLFEFDGKVLKEVYTNKGMRNHFNNSILLDGFLYGFDGNSNLGRVVQLTCMNMATGEVAWKKAGFGCGSLMIANKKLVILSETGTLVVAQASPKAYEEVTRSRLLNGRCWTVPVLLDGHVYARNAAGTLIAVKLPKR